MKILLSPAKSIDFEVDVTKNTPTQPLFLSEAEYLIHKLQKLSSRQISDLMSVSKPIADLNYERFQQWQLPFTKDNSKSAADIFTGMAYQGLDYPSLSIEERARGQEQLRILSGLYGVLKPLDLIQPYRLEMGTRFKITPKVKNLYLYWGDKIVNTLNAELEQDEFPILVNCASSEYFKAAKLKEIKGKVITPVFKDINKNGIYKVNMTFAKKARGLMTRFLITEQVDSIEKIKTFSSAGYWFCNTESTAEEFVFKRG
ncbi:peroxide stress protein YaaA [Putridiphycobacter roseus]|uniref:UPF0246 protein DNU06_13965 n=1 Tax=Putridiphycobacter roseus TaxID=2219161 RepID=A0A2W1MYE7_9FLAO|nr:peroxide stress protein YaaA [Putridiphycobacter roseus]PZE16230.1 peroxide stress protein YaaA [Putridiphycobacter roseus]